MRQIFGRQPVVIVAAIQATMVFFVSMGWLDFVGLRTAQDVTIVAAVLNAAGAVYLALGTTETLLAPAIELFKAIAGLLVFYGMDFGVDRQAMAIGAITAIFAFVHQPKTSPQRDLTLDPRDTTVLRPAA